MDKPTIALVNSTNESMELDSVLWEVLWKPLGLPRDVRDLFKVEGDSFELIALSGKRVVGGIVVNWSNDSEVEIRHIALVPEVQKQGIGQQLVTSSISIVSRLGYSRIHTIARNTSVGFFSKMNFKPYHGTPPEHPVFKKHGITFELMERKIGQSSIYKTTE